MSPIPHIIQYNGRLLPLDKPVVMAIVNATQDSFYSRHLDNSIDGLKRRIDDCVAQGATIIDIGGMSTRPGAPAIDESEEWNRIKDILAWTRQAYPSVWISVDTYRSKIALKSIEQGADMINDISGGQYDYELMRIVGAAKIPYIGMHIKGTPTDMVAHAQYERVTIEVLDYFIKMVKRAQDCGITDIIIDPGFGFAKNLEHNYELLSHLSSFSILNRPILIGVSRKKMIQTAINKDSTEALYGSVAAATLALQQGAHIIRTHDVAATVDAINVFIQYKKYQR